MTVTLDWLGVATFRLTIGDVVVFLDGYIDRVPGAPAVGLSTVDVERADAVLVGHSHFDHVWGVERIAMQTGATVIGSHETARVMRDAGVPSQQLRAVAGGEPVALSDDVLVRVYPSLHSCVWASGLGLAADEDCAGDVGLTQQQRDDRMAGALRPRAPRGEGAGGPGLDDAIRHLQETNQGAQGDGGPLAFVIDTPDGRVLWKDTSGHWTGILGDLRPDVALLAAAARPNVDGEPYQGSLAGYIAREVEMLKPAKVALCHHDDWLPPFTRPLDNEPYRHRLTRDAPKAEFLALDYLEGRAIL